MSGMSCLEAAGAFLQQVRGGERQLSDVHHYETEYGPSTGFVYFVAIGRPYITHVKIGFTSKSPAVRMASLQTGCPFKMRLLGFTFGNELMERELHDVLADDRQEGEWFEYSDYVMKVVHGHLESVWL